MRLWVGYKNREGAVLCCRRRTNGQWCWCWLNCRRRHVVDIVISWDRNTASSAAADATLTLIESLSTVTMTFWQLQTSGTRASKRQRWDGPCGCCCCYSWWWWYTCIQREVSCSVRKRLKIYRDVRRTASASEPQCAACSCSWTSCQTYQIPPLHCEYSHAVRQKMVYGKPTLAQSQSSSSSSSSEFIWTGLN